MAVLENIYISETAVLRDRGMMACPSPVLLILNLELLSNSMRGSRTCGIGAGFMLQFYIIIFSRRTHVTLKERKEEATLHLHAQIEADQEHGMCYFLVKEGRA